MAEKKKTTETKKISKGNEILQAINKIQVDMNSRFDEVNARLDEQHLLINALINRTDIHSAKIDSLTVEMAKLFLSQFCLPYYTIKSSMKIRIK